MKQVGIYYKDQDFSDIPAYFATREEAREFKKAERGWFINHGKDFCLFEEDEPEADNEKLREAIKVRDRSAQMHGRSDETECISDQFVSRQPQAMAIVNAWKFQNVQP